MRFQLWVVLLVSTLLYAQGSVTIFGTVTDPSGAAIPGVAVTAVNAETGAIRRAVSDPSGGYVISQLPIGSYSVRVEAAGFKSFVQEQINVQVDENRRVNVALEVGALSESVTVSGEAAQVETRSGALREVVDSRRIVELPLNGRNALQLQYLVAGSGGRMTAGQEQNDSVSINGSRTNSNNYTLDNGDNHDPYFNTPSVFPNPDALEEFSLQTNSYGADKGRNAGAVMNAVTRSGTNALHGSLFEFLRNEKLNARNFFANNVPPFKRNQFGGTVGGPIRKDKTFYFASYQRTSERSAPGSITPTVLTPAQRTGDFSGLGKPIKDPLGGTFPNGVIPASRLNKASLNFLNAFVPLPNRPQGLYTFSSQQKVDDDQVIAKIDHNLTAANQITGRFLFSYNDLNQSVGNVTLPGFLASIKYADFNTAITDTHIFRPTLVNVFTFGFIDIQRKQIPIVPGNKSWTDFGAGFTRAFPEAGSNAAPVGHDTQVDGYFQAQSRFPLNHFRKSFQFSDGLNWTRGAHLFKMGGDVRRSILNLQELF
ncbi:MAG: carboxypeptidase-like regulatory domain-containing protein, partial [Acidobacteriota bacterium]|nr:carboxypeptidase-like regulatory domain-containing protein [Acidobacteriota bacterium]